MLSLLWAVPTKIEIMHNVTECSPVIGERDGAPFDSLPGPWSWGSARFDLLDAALDETAGTFTRVESEALPVIGSLVRTVHSENITFYINGNETPLVLTAGQAVSNSRYTSRHADIGLRISDSALVTALYLRSAEGANLLGASPSVLEIGAGVGLVGIDLSLRGASVTLTDREPNLINAIHTNALAASADVRVGTLGWVTGDPQGIAKELQGTLDIVIGAAVCYKKEGMWALATLIQELGAPVTLIVNHPVGHQSAPLRLKAQLQRLVHTTPICP